MPVARPERPGENNPIQEVAEKTQRKWKHLAAVRQQVVRRKHDFWKYDAVFIMLSPENAKVERLIRTN
jgi:hypothetical protein